MGHSPSNGCLTRFMVLPLSSNRVPGKRGIAKRSLCLSITLYLSVSSTYGMLVAVSNPPAIMASWVIAFRGGETRLSRHENNAGMFGTGDGWASKETICDTPFGIIRIGNGELGRLPRGRELLC